MSTFKLKLRPIATKATVPPSLDVPIASTCLDLEALVSSYESTPLGKWKMMLMPLPPDPNSTSTAIRKKTMGEIREEVESEMEDATEEEKQTELRRRIIANNSASTPTAVALTVAEKTMSEYGVRQGETRTVEVVLDFGACHMSRSILETSKKGKEGRGEFCSKDAQGRCSCLDEEAKS